MKKSRWNLLMFFVTYTSTVILCTLLLPAKAISAPVKQFSPPTEITLVMYALNGDGSVNWQDYPDPHCSATGETAYVRGCTFYGTSYEPEFRKVYPFGDTYTITIGYETHSAAGDPEAELGYLHNVVAQEMAEGSPVTSYAAQAIAARTYAYHQTQGGQVALNNSSGYQVYIPYRYEGLGEGLPEGRKEQRQADVEQAISETAFLYMVPDDDEDSIKAHFGMDNCTYTEAGAFPYLASVYDPISAKSDPCYNSTYGTGYGGMGSAGASRWGYGNTSTYGTGDPWSVQWEHVAYILTHYYTRIHLHDADGERMTPSYRWVPLNINWHTSENAIPDFVSGECYSVTVAIQNTGVYPWIGSGQFALRAVWLTPAPEEFTTRQSATAETNLFRITHPVTPGGSLSATFTLRPPRPANESTNYILRFTMSQEQDDWVDFDDLEDGLPWPGYDVNVSVTRALAGPLYLPLIVSGIDDEPPSSLARP